MCKFSLFFALSIFSMAAAAVDVGGYSAGSGSAADSSIPHSVFECKKTGSADKVTLTIRNILAVRTGKEVPFKNGKLLDNGRGGKDSVLEYASDPTAFAEIFVFGLGKNWASKSAAIDSLDLSKALGRAQIQSESVSVDVRMTGDYQPVTLVVNGSQGLAWGGVVGDGFQGVNVDGKPYIMLPIDCNQGSEGFGEALGVMKKRR